MERRKIPQKSYGSYKKKEKVVGRERNNCWKRERDPV